MRNAMRCRRAIKQLELALRPIATHPLASAADADLGGLGRFAQRPLALLRNYIYRPGSERGALDCGPHPVTRTWMAREILGGELCPDCLGNLARNT